MITSAAQVREPPTIWGLTPDQLHERFWAARGVQVVRVGFRRQLARDAELYLLTDVHLHTIFRLARPIETLTWSRPRLLTIRLHDVNQVGYREHAVADSKGQFLKFERVYHGKDSRLGRIALTADRNLAFLWQQAESAREGWRMLRDQIDVRWRMTMSLEGSVYDRTDPHEEMHFIRELIQVWTRPDTTIQRIVRHGTNNNRSQSSRRDEAWADGQAHVDPKTRVVGPVWVGAGRVLHSDASVVGPAVLWDQPQARPEMTDIQWREIEPTGDPVLQAARVRKLSSFYRWSKRFFDVCAAIFWLMVSAPIFPLVMLAIWMEDGRPFFFKHYRETPGPHGPREFPCYKFRSMKKDAEAIKKDLVKLNEADGPQFFMEDDPRLTRVGRILRKFQVDEFPQFWNILRGHMSFVGPRPSPYRENQYCPAWRESRLSVRPGLTGLWQINRTREPDKDFQEWIRYDMEYVENASWGLDVKILFCTALMVIGLRKK